MIRPIITVLLFSAMLSANLGYAQQEVGFKNFTSFKQLVPGIDFFASNRAIVTPYEKPAAEAISKLKELLGPNLPKGAIFICSTLAQKDAVYEPKVLRMGYGWSLTAITSDVSMQEMMERMKSQMGGNIPPEFLTRLKNRPPEMMANAEKQMVSQTVQRIAYAVLQSMLGKNLQYRSSRLDDMGKSPLPDWLDIGIASYASGTKLNLSFLQQNMDQTFPLEDILSMSRPFTASSEGGGGGRGGGGGGGGGFNGGGQGMPTGNFGGGGTRSGAGQMPMGQMPMGGFGGGQGSPASGGSRNQGGFPGGGGSSRGGMQRTIPKDEQDRMLFDGQSSTFFLYMVEKNGIEKARELIKQVLEGKESREFIIKPEMLGPDFGKTEENWVGWVKAQKP